MPRGELKLDFIDDRVLIKCLSLFSLPTVNVYKLKLNEITPEAELFFKRSVLEAEEVHLISPSASVISTVSRSLKVQTLQLNFLTVESD